MTKDYTLLQSVFGGVYASDLGRSDEEAAELFKEMLKSESYKAELGNVLVSAFSDPSFSWIEAFEEFEVFSTDNEAEARDYAKEILWDVVFPGRDLPNPDFS